MVKNLPAVQETQIRFLGWEDSPGGRNGNPFQYSCLENPGQRSLAGYTPTGLRVRHDLVTEHTHTHPHTHPFPSNPRKPPVYFLTPDLPILDILYIEIIKLVVIWDWLLSFNIMRFPCAVFCSCNSVMFTAVSSSFRWVFYHLVIHFTFNIDTWAISVLWNLGSTTGHMTGQ